MKLCRFELKAQPGEIRSGVVHGGKVYETDGAEATAIHEAAEIRPLPPIGQPPSIRVFRCMPGLIEPDETPAYFYASPSALTGASPIIPRPEGAELDFEPYVAVVIAADATNVSVEEADDLILGYTILNLIVSRDAERHERRAGSGPGRSTDLASPIGPVLTTPDELEDSVIDAEFGRRLQLSAVARVNGVERRRGVLSELPFTFAQAISTASEGRLVRAGDVIALGPVAMGETAESLTFGDEVQVAVDQLGMLSLRVG